MARIDEVAAKAEETLAAIVPGAVCVAQEWDQRIDCIVRLPDGKIVGEMVLLREATDDRFRATGERLRQRLAGADVQLVNELRSPVRIVPRRN